MNARAPARPGRTSAVVALLLAAQLAAAGLLLRATAGGVWLLGHPLGGVCWFRRLTGLACPTCGMTRSIVLTLHGRLATALRLNLAGPAWVAAVATLAAALLWLAWRERRHGAEAVAAARRRVRWIATAQAAAFALLLAANWILALADRG
jgi:hypothetical protein